MDFKKRFIHFIQYDEGALIADMIKIYCKHNHHTKGALCEDCDKLHQYALQRIKHCPYGVDKPVCLNCKIHCYNRYYKTMVKEVMRFSGPRIMFYKPVTALRYMIKKSLTKEG